MAEEKPEEQAEGTLEEKEVFSVPHLFIKFTSRLFLVWVVITALTCTVVLDILLTQVAPDKYNMWINKLIYTWAGVSVLYMGGNVLIDALAKSVEKASITLNTNISASATTSISGAAGGGATATASDSGRK
jgi:hypothetical protein